MKSKEEAVAPLDEGTSDITSTEYDEEDIDSSKFPRPQSSYDSLQIAIDRWIEFEYGIWVQTQQQSLDRLGIWSIVLRVLIIVLAGALTIMSDLDAIPRSTITVVSGVLTIITGIEGYLKLADRKTMAENRNRELLAERDRMKHEWMVKVELETDDDKALEAAKKLLEAGPKSINEIVNKYISRAHEGQPSKPA